MDPDFVAILQKLITEQGKETLLNTTKCKALLADYTRNDYKKESRFLLQAIDVGVQKAIDTTDNITICKLQQIRLLHEDYGLDEKVAVGIVDTLALVLRGDTAKTEIQKEEPKQEKAEGKPRTAVVQPQQPVQKNKERIGRQDHERLPKVKQDLSEYRESIAKYQKCISVDGHLVGLRTDGTVVAVGNNKDGQCNTGSWRDIIAVVAGSHVRWLKDDAGPSSVGYTLGLKADGTIVAVGNNSQYNTESWRYIVAISSNRGVCWPCTVGLKVDGTVIVAGRHNYGQYNTESWRDIIAIAAGNGHIVGLKTDGTVVADGENDFDRCNTENWRDIVAVAVGRSNTVGLKSDGTVVAVGYNNYGKCNTESWQDIVAIGTNDNTTVGLKSDGTVVATGENDRGQCNTVSWRDIIAIAAGSSHTVGLKSDGTVVAVGYNEDGRWNTESWQGIGPVNKELCLQQMKEEKLKEDKRIAEEKLREIAEKKVREEQKRIEQSNKWASQGLCRYCGGKLGGLFTKKCKSCYKVN